MILWARPRDMWCTSILHSGGLGREGAFSLCVLDGERVGSRLYRRASNRHISISGQALWPLFTCGLLVVR